MTLKNKNILHIELYLEKQTINFTKSGTKKKEKEINLFQCKELVSG